MDEFYYDEDYVEDDGQPEYYEGSDMFAEDETFSDLCETCIAPTLLNAVDQLVVLFMFSLVLRWLKLSKLGYKRTDYGLVDRAEFCIINVKGTYCVVLCCSAFTK